MSDSSVIASGVSLQLLDCEVWERELFVSRIALIVANGAFVRIPVGSKCVRLTRNPASERYCNILFNLKQENLFLFSLKINKL